MTHFRPHLDEHLALRLLWDFGCGEFIGVNNASVSFDSAGGLPKGKSEKDYPDTVFLGVGGGKFDDHARGKCCAVLVADHLGLSQRFYLKSFLKETYAEDKHARVPETHIAAVIKAMNMMDPAIVTFDSISKWFTVFFDAFIKAEKRRWALVELELKGLNLSSENAIQIEMNTRWAAIPQDKNRFTVDGGYEMIREESGQKIADAWKGQAQAAFAAKQERFIKAKVDFKTNGETFFINTVKKNFRIGVITSDNDQMNAAARHSGCDIVIQRNSNDNVQIFTKRTEDLEVDLTAVAVYIREEECKRRNIAFLGWNILESVGSIKKLPMWFLHDTGRNKQMLYNGSLTADAVEPTIIPLDEIRNLVRKGLQRTYGRPQQQNSFAPQARKENVSQTSVVAKA